jgi:hypothetical protein
MNNNATIMKTNDKQKKVSIIQRMIENKRAVHDYIAKNATLKGFKDEQIKFAKPI